jgi:hypothetical protein
MVIYVIKCKPFKDELQQVIAASDEFVIIFGMIALYMLWMNQENTAFTKKMGFIIIGIILASIVKNMSVIIYKMITSAYGKFKKWAHKKLGHEKNKRRRLRKEARVRAEKERIRKEEDDLLTYGITLDPADADPNHNVGRVIDHMKLNNSNPDFESKGQGSIVPHKKGRRRKPIRSVNGKSSKRDSRITSALEKLTVSSIFINV